MSHNEIEHKKIYSKIICEFCAKSVDDPVWNGRKPYHQCCYIRIGQLMEYEVKIMLNTNKKIRIKVEIEYLMEVDKKMVPKKYNHFFEIPANVDNITKMNVSMVKK